VDHVAIRRVVVDFQVGISRRAVSWLVRGSFGVTFAASAAAYVPPIARATPARDQTLP
jgi:hypothetical protein